VRNKKRKGKNAKDKAAEAEVGQSAPEDKAEGSGSEAGEAGPDQDTAAEAAVEQPRPADEPGESWKVVKPRSKKQKYKPRHKRPKR
jgi:hypothetical protein